MQALLHASAVEDVSDLDPSLSRLHSLQVPMEALIQSLERVYPSRLRRLPSEDGKTQLAVIREKQMLHIVHDEAKGSFSIYSCLRKPINPKEAEALRACAIEHCSLLVSHLSYHLWASLLQER